MPVIVTTRFSTLFNSCGNSYTMFIKICVCVKVHFANSDVCHIEQTTKKVLCCAHLKVLCGLTNVHDDDADEDVCEDEVAKEDEDNGIHTTAFIICIQTLLDIRPAVHLENKRALTSLCSSRLKRGFALYSLEIQGLKIKLLRS